jgi:transketolase
MTSEQLAWKIRRHGIEMTHLSHSSHIGSVLSVADIIAVLYNDVMKIYPNDPKNDNRDRFILSKGHAGAAVYAALAEMGFFDKEILKSHCANGSVLSGHVSHKNVPGVEVSTGSLGNGIGVAVGMALAAKMDNKKHRVFVVIGDGECDEGSVWEAALFANQFKLDNLVVIIDHNKLQGLGFCEEVMSTESLNEKWKSFGWHVIEIDGNDHVQLNKALTTSCDAKPICIVANTIKGKGISFMENKLIWHYRDPQGNDYERAIKELEGKYYEK